MHTDITQPSGPKKRITNCVGENIRIRMSQQSLFKRYVYSAKD